MIEYRNGIFGLHGDGFSYLLRVSGGALLAGIRLPSFRGTGYDENQRTLTDFASRLYIIEEDDPYEES